MSASLSVQALTPAMDDWRRRITGLASRFERLKGQSPGDLPALAEAQQNVESAEHHVHGAQQANQQVNIAVYCAVLAFSRADIHTYAASMAYGDETLWPSEICKHGRSGRSWSCMNMCRHACWNQTE